MNEKMVAVVRNSKILHGLYGCVRPLAHKILAIQNRRIHAMKCKRLREYGPGILRLVHTTFAKEGIRYFLDYGSMLGVVRDHGFIPFDIDMDNAVFAGQVSPCKLLTTLEAIGFEFLTALAYEDTIFEMTFKKDGINVDFFYQFPKAEKQVAIETLRREDRVHAIALSRPLVREIVETDVYGIKVNIPSNYGDMMRISYGDSWRVPDANWRPNLNDGYRRMLPGFLRKVDRGEVIAYKEKPFDEA